MSGYFVGVKKKIYFYNLLIFSNLRLHFLFVPPFVTPKRKIESINNSGYFCFLMTFRQ